MLLWACLVWHEIGHCVASVVLGGRGVARITPVFGWAEVTTFPDARQGWVAFGGPAANLMAAAGLAVAGGALVYPLTGAPTLDVLTTIHVVMGLGNLLPVMPLDGGRILRSLSLT